VFVTSSLCRCASSIFDARFSSIIRVGETRIVIGHDGESLPSPSPSHRSVTRNRSLSNNNSNLDLYRPSQVFNSGECRFAIKL